MGKCSIIKSFINKTLRKITGYYIASELREKSLLEFMSTLQNDYVSLQNDYVSLQNDYVSLQNLKTKADFEYSEAQQKIYFLGQLAREDVSRELVDFCAMNLVSSKSQILQDLMAGFLIGMEGYFCEFGASDGVAFSNTFLLESVYGWKGILAEPSKFWHKELFNNRKCSISTKCLYSSSGLTMTFEEDVDPLLSTIKEFTKTGIHAANRHINTHYQVESISLLDLLEQNNAPSHIDFLSVDTEGSEFNILQSFDFTKYTFGLICVEHNFGADRIAIKQLIENAGYIQVLKTVSQWDDWYVSKELNAKLF